MDPEFYRYIKELHIFIEHQAKKLKRLESDVEALQAEIVKLKERPPFQVGNIEYKFDQLKVETLEGTLNIGLNPSDLEGISEFSVDNQNIKAPISPKNLFNRSMEIENEIREYLEIELPEIYQSAQEKLKFTVDDSYFDFIKEDILKQLPNRVHSHLNSLTTEERATDKAAKNNIVQKMKKEIQQGVYLFLDQLQKQTKEEKN